MASLPFLPRELQIYIYAFVLGRERREAATTIQRCARRHLRPRLHFGHARSTLWPSVRQRLLHKNYLQRLYPYPLVRYEWRTELESWFPVHDLDGLVADVEERLHWGDPAFSLLSILHNDEAGDEDPEAVF